MWREQREQERAMVVDVRGRRVAQQGWLVSLCKDFDSEQGIEPRGCLEKRSNTN